jgi:hypothetical protein
MARPPNYSFERSQRDRAKEEKAAEKAAAKLEQRELNRAKTQVADSSRPGVDRKD